MELKNQSSNTYQLSDVGRMTVMTFRCWTSLFSFLVVSQGHFRVESNTSSTEPFVSTNFQDNAVASVSHGGQIVIQQAALRPDARAEAREEARAEAKVRAYVFSNTELERVLF